MPEDLLAGILYVLPVGEQGAGQRRDTEQRQPQQGGAARTLLRPGELSGRGGG
jgi:hypothetical protein